MIIIPESEMNFRNFEETKIFHIENSRIYRSLGSGIKTVEFVLRYDKNSIVFLEAKKTCPNEANRYESEEKTNKFEEYYSSITEKFIASLQIYIASLLGKFDDTSEIGSDLLLEKKNLSDIRLKCILVIKNTDDVSWLAGPLAELKSRLMQYRKIWGIDVAVLNEELAEEYNLLC